MLTVCKQFPELFLTQTLWNYVNALLIYVPLKENEEAKIKLMGMFLLPVQSKMQNWNVNGAM